MLLRSRRILHFLPLLGLLFSALNGCRPSSTVPIPSMELSNGTPTLTPPPTIYEETPSPPPTEIPLAVRVNGIEITMLEYQAELKMFQEIKGTDLAQDDEKVVLDDLINRALLASAAAENGFVITDNLIEERIQLINTQMEENQSLDDWMGTYNFDEQTFHRALGLTIASTWMRDQIFQAVPIYSEQVHARQIILYDAATANDVYQQLQAGNSFRNLALKYDPLTGGDLGWFPRGYLPHPAVEEAAFSLEPENYSSIIETSAGFHIIQVLEIDPQRELLPDAMLVLQRKALQDWLDQQREKTQIEVLLPTL